MGFSSISPWSLLLILGIVILIFGTKKIKSMGRDLGKAYKDFKVATKEENKKSHEE